MNYEIKNENILYEKILNANLFEQDFESSFEHPTCRGELLIFLWLSVQRKDDICSTE